MLSKNKIKLIQSLNRKKNRDETGFFLVEGNKMVEEALLSGYRIESMICTSRFLDQHSTSGSNVNEIIETDAESIQKASLLKSPQEALALIYIPENLKPAYDTTAELILALDFIQDPGNMGTILRIADWFGIKTIICSENTVDIYNPKVVQASMGAIFRIKTWNTNLRSFITENTGSHIPVYGTFLEGQNIYSETLTPNGIIVMGNEGNGISDPIKELVTQKLYIPSFSSGKGSESLNVAIAAAICCSEFRRRE
jgi:TrmH family RNA methyltransferase